MDIIFLKGLTVETVIGIYEWERNTKQTIVLDIEMAFDITQAAKTDDIVHTLDYKAVSDRIIEFVRQSDFFLVEKLIEEIANLLRNEFGVRWLKIVLNKRGAVPAAESVGIMIERGAK
jgi:7,8-dihydroneopterin aldolase/epimerase/oxygenase